MHAVQLFSQQGALAVRRASGKRSLKNGMEREGGGIIGLPFLGELWGEVGGEESWEEALDTVSSACRRCRSFPSSDRDRIFFRDCGELVPADVCKKKKRRAELA